MIFTPVAALPFGIPAILISWSGCLSFVDDYSSIASALKAREDEKQPKSPIVTDPNPPEYQVYPHGYLEAFEVAKQCQQALNQQTHYQQMLNASKDFHHTRISFCSGVWLGGGQRRAVLAARCAVGFQPGRVNAFSRAGGSEGETAQSHSYGLRCCYSGLQQQGLIAQGLPNQGLGGLGLNRTNG